MAQADPDHNIQCDILFQTGEVDGYSNYMHGSDASYEAFTAISPGSSYWLRLKRQGDTWTCSVSTDGSAFSIVNTFTQPLAMTSLGVWAGNSTDDAPAPAVTALFDYFKPITASSQASNASQQDQLSASLFNRSIWPKPTEIRPVISERHSSRLSILE
jgi:hypothetical protein